MPLILIILFTSVCAHAEETVIYDPVNDRIYMVNGGTSRDKNPTGEKEFDIGFRQIDQYGNDLNPKMENDEPQKVYGWGKILEHNGSKEYLLMGAGTNLEEMQKPLVESDSAAMEASKFLESFQNRIK